MPYVVRGKCVYKKGKDGEPGKKVGCTKGSVKKYLAALHMHTDESLDRELTKEDLEEMIREDVAAVADVKDMESAIPTTLLAPKSDLIKTWSDIDPPDINPYDLGIAKTTAKDDPEKITKIIQDLGIGASILGFSLHPKAQQGPGTAKSLGSQLRGADIAVSGQFTFEEQKINNLKQIIREELEKLLHEQTI